MAASDYNYLNGGMLDPNDPILQQMAMQAAPVPQSSLPVPPTSNPMSQIQVSPLAKRDALSNDIYSNLKNWSNQRNLQLQQLQQYIQNYGNMPQRTDYRALAAFLGNLPNTSNEKNPQLAQVAQEMAPESPQTRLENLIGFQANQAKLTEDQAANAYAKLLQAQQMAAFQNQRLGIQQGGLDLRKDKIAQDMANKIDTDPILQGIAKQKNQIAIDQHTLDTAPILTPQIFNELQQGLSNAIAGGKQSALGNLERTEYATAETNLQALKQRLTNHPEDINSPEIKKVLSDTFARLNRGYDLNAASRANQIAGGRSAGLNSAPQAVEVLNNKVQAFAPAAQAASAPVKMIAPDGSTRLVPYDKVKDALNAGGKMAP